MTETLKNQAKTIRINPVRILGKNQMFTTEYVELRKRMLNQEKRNFKMMGKLCSVFTCPCQTSFSRLVEFWKPVFPVKDPAWWLWRKQIRLFWKTCICLFKPLWGLPEGLMQVCSLFCITENSLRLERHFLKTLEDKWAICSHLEKKSIVETNNVALISCEKRLWREFLWKVRVFKSACVY